MLLGVSRQLADQPARVRQVEHDQPIGQLGVGHGESPGHHPAPVVAHDHRFARPEMLDHGEQIADELFGLVVLDPIRLAAQVIAPLIDGDDVKVFASAGIWARQEYQKSGKPWTMTSSGSSFFPRLT